MVSGLQEFILDDGMILLSVFAAYRLFKSWKESNWFQVASVLIIYALIVSVLKGQQVLAFFGKLLRMIGIETGL